MTEVKEAVASTTEEILRLRSADCKVFNGRFTHPTICSQGNHLEEAAVVGLCLPLR